jgi:hypothetical protein
MIRTLATAMLLASMPTAALAAGDVPQCKGSPKVVGDCLTVYGKLSVYSGKPSIRIWPIGTKKLYGVEDTDGDPETVYLPPNLRKALESSPRELNGKYQMCPLDVERDNRLTPVCLESASQLGIDFSY